MTPLRLAFAGTPEFSVAALDALHQRGHQIAAVYTQPDRPAGRGRKLRASAVAQRAAELQLPLHKPARFDAAAQQDLAAADVDYLIVVAYGLILPQAALDIPRGGGLNIHASLLPRWRGAAPIQRALLAGDAQTGITIMQMDSGLDTGDMLLKRATPISAQDTSDSLHDRLAELGAALICEALDRLSAVSLTAEPQDHAAASYAAKLDKAEARIVWQQSAEQIARQIRGYNPVPVAWTELGNERIRILEAEVADAGDLSAGRIRITASGELLVGCAGSALRLLCLQRPGGKPQAAAELAKHWNVDGQSFS